MNDKQFKIEHLLYILAFVLALLLRLVNLGLLPLGEFEATWAMQALAVSKGGESQTGQQHTAQLHHCFTLHCSLCLFFTHKLLYII